MALAYGVQVTSSPSQSPAAAQSVGPSGAMVNQTALESQLRGPMRLEVGVSMRQQASTMFVHLSPSLSLSLSLAVGLR